MKVNTKITYKISLAFAVLLLILSCGCGKEKNEPQTLTNKEAKKTVVYVTKTGECYHTKDCYTLHKSKIKKKLNEVCEEYRPCKICLPPEVK